MLTVMTLNLWGNNQWHERRPAIVEWIADFEAANPHDLGATRSHPSVP